MGWEAALLPVRRSRLRPLLASNYVLVVVALFFMVVLLMAFPTLPPAPELGIMLRAAPQLPIPIAGQRRLEALGFYIYKPSAAPSFAGPAVFYTLFEAGKLPAIRQQDAFTSIEQVRALNPAIPIFVVLQRKDLPKMASDAFLFQAVHFQVHVFAYDSSVAQGRRHLLDALRDQDLTRDPDYMGVERMLAVADIADSLSLLDFFHIKSDQMVYVNLAEHAQALRSCGIRLALPAVVQNDSAPGFAYFQDASAATDFAHFILGTLDSRAGRALARPSLADIGGRIEALPTLSGGGGEGRCLGASYVYDVALGPSRDLPGGQLGWRQCERTAEPLFCPWAGGVRVVNLRVHAEQMSRFSSKLNASELPTAG